jgi:hypothetical protein
MDDLPQFRDAAQTPYESCTLCDDGRFPVNPRLFHWDCVKYHLDDEWTGTPEQLVLLKDSISWLQ